MEGYITLFDNTPAEGKRPHYKGFLKIEGVEHEFALWPAKDGKKGFSGKYKPKEAREVPSEAKRDIEKLESTVLFDEIPFAYLIACAISGAMLLMQLPLGNLSA